MRDYFHMPEYLKRRPVIGVFFLIAMPIVMAYLLMLLCAKSSFFIGFSIPPQDCEMTKAILKGKIIDKQGNPIPNVDIYFENTPVDNSTPAKHKLSSDTHGLFGPDPIFFFKCEPINFSFAASGFQEKKASYILDFGLLNSLPGDLQVTLERSS